MNIVWIHGFPLSSHVFDHQRAIGAHHVMPDLPGFGGTAAGNEKTIDDYARFVLDRFDGRAILAGLSMGGYICLAAARIAPERIGGLILIDTRETPDTPEGRRGRYDTIEKVKQDGISVVIDSMLPKMLTPSAPPQKVAEVRRIMESSSKEGVINALRAMAERQDSSDLLPRLNVPVILLAGSNDTITPPSDAERMSHALPDAKLVTIRGAAHLSNMEKPEEFNAAVSEWLAAVSR